MTEWFGNLTRTEKKTLYVCFGGWAVDAFDTQIYSFLIPTFISLWHMSRGEAGMLGTAALIASAFGGWMAGILCDRIGRVKVMQIAIAWFVVFSIASGFTQNVQQLLITRSLSGIGFGGEWVAGSVLMGEVVRAEYRGKAVGTVQSAYAIGYGLAALASSVLFAHMSEDLAWRWMFWVGLLPAVIVFVALQTVREPAVFLAAKRNASAASKAPITPFAIFQRGYIRTTGLTSLLALGIQGSAFSLAIWLPTFLKTVRHVSTVDVGLHVLIFTVGSFIGYISSAYLADAKGRRSNFVTFGVLNLIFIPAYFYMPVGASALFALDLAIGFASFGIYSALGPYFSELFPALIRATGQGFSYNFGRGLGAFFPALIGFLAESAALQLREAIVLTAMGGYAFVFLAIALLPETRALDLNTLPEVEIGKSEPVSQEAAPIGTVSQQTAGEPG